MRGHNLARDTFRSEQRCSSGVASMTVHHRPKPSATQRASTLTECQVIGRTPSQFGRMSRRASAVCMRRGRAACGRVAAFPMRGRGPRRSEGRLALQPHTMGLAGRKPFAETMPPAPHRPMSSRSKHHHCRRRPRPSHRGRLRLRLCRFPVLLSSSVCILPFDPLSLSSLFLVVIVVRLSSVASWLSACSFFLFCLQTSNKDFPKTPYRLF